MRNYTFEINTTDYDGNITTSKKVFSNVVSWDELLKVFYHHIKSTGYMFTDSDDAMFQKLMMSFSDSDFDDFNSCDSNSCDSNSCDIDSPDDDFDEDDDEE